MEDKKLRDRINRIRDAMRVITEEINLIYNDNAEKEDKEMDYDKIMKDKEEEDGLGELEESSTPI